MTSGKICYWETAVLNLVWEGGTKSVKEKIADALSFTEYYACETPLTVASKDGHEEIVEYLLSLGVDPKFPDQNMCTPLSHAIKVGNVKIVEMLLSVGASPNVTLGE